MIGEEEVANSSELPTWGIVVNTPINVRVLLWWLCAVYWLPAIAAVVLRRRLPSFGGAVKYGGRQSKAVISNRDEQADREKDADAVFTPPRSHKKEDEDSSEKEENEDTTATQEYLTPFTSAHFARREKTKKGSDEISSSSGDDDDAEGGESGGPSQGQQMSPTVSNGGGVISTRLVSSTVDSQGDEMMSDDATSTFPTSPPTTREANGKLSASSSSLGIRGRLVGGSMSLVLSPLQYQVSRKHSFIAFYVVGSISSLALIVLIIITTWWWNTEVPSTASLPFFFANNGTSKENPSYLQCPCFTASSSLSSSASSVDNGQWRLPPVTKGSFKDSERRRRDRSDGALTPSPPHLACGGRTTPSGLVLSLPTILGAFDRRAELRRLHHSSVGIPQGGSSGGGVGGRMLFKYAFGGGGGEEEIHVSDRHTTSRQFTLGQLLLDMRLEATTSGTNTSKSNADGKPKVSRSTACCGPSHPKTGRAGSQRNPFSSKPEDTPTKECPCHPARQHSSSKPSESPQHCWLSEPGVVPPPSWYVVFIAITPLSLFLLHCVVRLYECHAVFVFRDSSNTLDLNVVSQTTPSSLHQGSVATSPDEEVPPPPFQPPTAATKKATVAAVSSPDVVTLFAAVSGCSFYVAAPVSIGVTSLETLIKFTEVGLSALMKTAEVASAAEAMTVAAEGSGGGGSNPKSHQSISLLDTAVFGGGVLLVGFVVILIFSLIFFFLQGLQVFHHVILARLQRRRLAQRRIRIDNYRMSLLDSRRRSSEGGSGEASQKKKKRSSVTAASSIARGLPPDLEPPYVYPYEEGLFSHVLEPHYAMEAAMYVCIIVLTVTLFLYAEGLSQLLQSARPSSLVPSKNLKLDATYLTYPQPVGGDFAVWGYRPLLLLFPHHNSESASSTADGLSDATEIGLLGNDGQATREPALSSLWMICNTLLSPQLVGSIIPSLSTMEHVLFACRLWVSLVPTILVALFSVGNLNTTAQEHREFWVRVGGVIDLPRYNVIPGLL